MSCYTLEGRGWHNELWMSWEQWNITEKTFKMETNTDENKKKKNKEKLKTVAIQYAGVTLNFS